MSESRAPVAVVIGCLAIHHRGDHRRLEVALDAAPRVVVVLGSAFHARTPRDPFTWEERAAMIRLALPEGERSRVRFAPVRDYYDDARWAQAVQSAVVREGGEGTPIRLVLQATEELDRYSECFPRWGTIVTDPGDEVDARRLRCILLRAAAGQEAGRARRVEAALEVIAAWVPEPVLDYLRSWTQLPFFAELGADQVAIDDAQAKWKGAPYEPIFTTVDAVVRHSGHVLLVQRKGRPGPGLWAVPGGFLDPGERLLDGAMRELREETGLGLHATMLRRALARVVVFDHPARSQRGRIITHAHLFELQHDRLPHVQGSDDAANARWVPEAELPAMEQRFFEDHFHILDEFLRLTR